MTQLPIAGMPAPTHHGEWLTLYSRVRSDGTKMSVALPPRRDVLIIRVGDYHVRLELGELSRVSDAIDAAREVL